MNPAINDARHRPPTGWLLAGDSPTDYLAHVDAGPQAGTASGCLRSQRSPQRRFGTLMQQFAARAWRGRRLRLVASVRLHDVAGRAGLWMRIDGARGRILAFDNMQDRPLAGTQDWTQLTIVLDVPRNAQLIAFGVLLAGTGQVWIADVQMDAVGKGVALTGTGALPAAPVNLDFSGLAH